MAFLKYSLYRLLIIAVFTAILIWLGAHPYLAVALAAVLGALVSYLVLPRTRQEVVAQMAAHDPLRRRQPRTDAASAEEDAVLDVQTAPAPDAQTTPTADTQTTPARGSALNEDQHNQ